MAFNVIIKTQATIKSLKLSNEAKEILSESFSVFDKLYKTTWEDDLPIAGKNTQSKEVKVRRAYKLDKLAKHIETKFPNYNIRVSDISLTIRQKNTIVFKFTAGEGSRNRKAGGGSAGLKFEKDLAQDLLNYPNDKPKFTHKKIVDSIHDILLKDYNIDMLQDKYDVRIDGGKNQKRSPTFSSGGLKFNPSGNIGSIVSDISVFSGNKKAYLSLKYTSQFYMINTSMTKPLDLLKPDVNSELRNSSLLYFGFVPKLFCEPYDLVSDDEIVPSQSQTRKNWESILKEAIGYGYIYIVGGNRHDIVINTIKTPKVSVQSVDNILYAIKGKRKYSKIGISVNIDGRNYKIDCQFRGTKATDKYPKYLRVLVKT